MSTQAPTSLEAKLQQYPSAVEMLRNAPVGGYQFPFTPEFTNWRDEQEAWQKTVVLFDQSFHMKDVYFEGPDVKRLLSDVAVNTMKNFAANRAKQIVTCNPDGYVIGDAILFGLSDDLEHRVGDVHGAFPKTAFAGWFLDHADPRDAIHRHRPA